MNLRYQLCACLYQGRASEVFLVQDIAAVCIKAYRTAFYSIFGYLFAGDLSKRSVYAGMAAA